MTITPDSPHEQRIVKQNAVESLQQNRNALKYKDSLPLVSRTLANLVHQNSKKIRRRLINRAKHLDCSRLKMIVRC